MRATYLASVALMAASCGLGACTDSVRYQVLSFFLDGVPAPGSQAVVETAAPQRAAGEQVAVAQAPTRVRRYSAHTPYRENRCAGCHSLQTGGMVREIEDGLCRLCHSDLVNEPVFLHGPVAVDDCTVCHHYHTAPFENLMLFDGDAACYECHDREELIEGDHHAAVNTERCITCHDPHGGADRFFLKPGRGTP